MANFSTYSRNHCFLRWSGNAFLSRCFWPYLYLVGRRCQIFVAQLCEESKALADQLGYIKMANASIRLLDSWDECAVLAAQTRKLIHVHVFGFSPRRRKKILLRVEFGGRTCFDYFAHFRMIAPQPNPSLAGAAAVGRSGPAAGRRAARPGRRGGGGRRCGGGCARGLLR